MNEEQIGEWFLKFIADNFKENIGEITWSTKMNFQVDQNLVAQPTDDSWNQTQIIVRMK